MVNLTSLQKYSLFGGLLPEDIERVRCCLVSASFEAGAPIQVEGQPNDSIYFIIEGKVEVSKRGAFLVELKEGDTFGEMEFLDVMPSAATVTAVVPTKVARITNRALHEIYKTDLKTFAIIVMNLARDLSRHLRRMDEIMVTLREAAASHTGLYGEDAAAEDAIPESEG